MASNYENIDLKKAFVSTEPKIEKITPSSGKYAGKETDVAEFNVGKPSWTKNPATGEFIKGDTTYYQVKMYGEEGARTASHLKVGMSVNVEGSKSTENWKDKSTGEERTKNIITAKDVSLNLSQSRVKGIEFDPSKEKDLAQTADKAKAPKESQTKAAKAPTAQKKSSQER